MSLGSFAHDALADLSDEDLGRMLELHESLFVEHKRGIGSDEDGHELMKAVAAFANTAGGWVLVGVEDGRPVGSEEPWASSEDGTPTLGDAVRDRLRDRLDPLPAFEATVRRSDDGPVGVVRVYESSDTPHVSIANGAVFVREVAGSVDVNAPRKPGAGRRGERAFRATQIRSRQQLLELTTRGQAASQRVAQLLDLTQPLPLVEAALPLKLEPSARGLQPAPANSLAVVARMAPLTLAPRFQGWATTTDASAAVLGSGEELAKRPGLNLEWIVPDPAGAGARIPLGPDRRMTDAFGETLGAAACVVVDAAGVAGAAFEIAHAAEGNRPDVSLAQLSRELILPVLEAAAAVLVKGEFLGRARCQIDILRLAQTFGVEGAPEGRGRPWVSTQGDIGMPAGEEQIAALARRVATACGRAAGIPTWD